MTVSSSYDFDMTCAEIIQEAFRNVGALGDTESLSAEQTAIGRKRLNMLVRALQTRDVFLWKEAIVTQATVDGTATYALNAQYLAVRRVWLRENNIDYDVELLSRDQYEDLPDKADESRPTGVYVSRTLSGLTLNVYPTPDAAYTLRVLAETKASDFDSVSNTADAPPWFLRPLVLMLSADLSLAYGVADLNRVALLRDEGLSLLDAALRRTDEPVDFPVMDGYHNHDPFRII